jgi:hypothetical protein
MTKLPRSMWRKASVVFPRHRPAAPKPEISWKTSVWSPLIVACVAAILTSILASHSASELETTKADNADKLEHQKATNSATLEKERLKSANELALHIADLNIELEREKLADAHASELRKERYDLQLIREAKIEAALNKYSTVIMEQYAAESDFLYTMLATGFGAPAYEKFERRMAATATDENASEIALSLLSPKLLRRLHVMKDEVITVHSHIGIARDVYSDPKLDAKTHYQSIFIRLFWSRSLLAARLANIANDRDTNAGFRPEDLAKIDYQELKDAMTITAPDALGKTPDGAMYPYKRQR